jgi:hypothetical protein
MKKILSTLIGISLVIGLGASPTFAANIQGDKCLKVGGKVVVSGKTYTCIKSGTRKIWRQATKPSITRPVPVKPTTTEPVSAERVVLTWDNAYLNAAQMKSDIWESSLIRKMNPKQVVIDRSIFSSPNAVFGQTDFVVTLNRAETYFSWAIPSLQYRVLHYSKSDLAWAQDKFREFYGPNGELPSCPGPSCFGGTAQKTQSNWGHINLAFDFQALPQSLQAKDNNYNHLLTHEFVHLVQFAQSNSHSLGSSPQWFVEGGANFFAALIRSDTRTEYYVATAEGDLWGLDDQAKVVGYLNNPDTYPAGTAYNIGMRLTQALVGIYGPEKVMRLYGAASETASFSDAFKLAVGDDWELVKPKLAATVFALRRSN